jgi:hypothetical protein
LKVGYYIVKPVNDLEKLHAGDVENMGLLFHGIDCLWYDVPLKMFGVEFAVNISQT